MSEHLRCSKCGCPILRAAAWVFLPPHSYPDLYLCPDCGRKAFDSLTRHSRQASRG